MRRFALLAAVLLPALAVAADDLTVLTPGPADPPPKKALHSFLLAECQKHFDARKAAVEKLKTPADVAARQERLRKQFVAAIGGFPEKTPLNARTVGVLKRDGYRVEKVIYESSPDHHVTANLYVPDGPGPFPAVVMPLGHSQNGKAAEYMQRGAILHVKNGFVALVYDPIGQGERSQLLDKLGAPAIKGSTSEHTMCGVGALPAGRCTASFRIWDGIRSIDYVAARPEVDAKRIGCTGCSGGGTLTSYLMALDDRVAAAAPSCYLTSLERLFATIGPQDGEQNIPGQVAFGLDHADYIFLRAPKPTLMCTATRDFFDIQGAWATFREAKRVYSLLGFPERVDLMESDGGHGYPKAHREAVVRFMNRWLRNVTDPVTEGDFPIEKDADLRCTRTGQVLEDLKGRSVFDLNAALAGELAKQRAAKKWTPNEFRNQVTQLIGLPGTLMPVDVANHKLSRADGYDIQRKVLVVEPGVAVPALVFLPHDRVVGPPVIYVSDRGKAAVCGTDGPVEKLVKAGRTVWAVDLRGWGETAPGPAPPAGVPTFGPAYKESFIGMHLNRPLLGQRVYDLRAVIRFAAVKQNEPVDVIAAGAAGPVALHAAVLNDRIGAVTIDGSLISWDLVARTPVTSNQLAGVVPGALKVYDLPDLAGRIAPRRLTIVNPTDAYGVPAEKAVIDAAYQPVRAAYEKAGAADKLTVTTK
jgi:dienelactone hydrolase/pimeloyl-ACP methyl ester carboxylesterase